MNSGKFDAEKRDKDDVLFSDKRTSERINREINVNFEVSVDGPHNFFAGFTQDISKGGVFLATHQVYPIGTKMKLSFEIEGINVEVEAIVRWARKPENLSGSDLHPGMGLQFLNTDEKLIAAFESFLEKKEPLLIDEE
jgi:uncharacterized protein (TIGR02266 family)